MPAGSFLRFMQAFRFEEGFDGGVVEYSTDGGGTWTDVDPNIYNGSIGPAPAAEKTALDGRDAYTGDSYGFDHTSSVFMP